MASSYFIRCIYSRLKKFTKNSALPNFLQKYTKILERLQKLNLM